MMVITLRKKTHYGKDFYYPTHNQEEFFALTKTKTLTIAMVKALQSLGFEVVIETPQNIFKNV